MRRVHPLVFGLPVACVLAIASDGVSVATVLLVAVSVAVAASAWRGERTRAPSPTPVAPTRRQPNEEAAFADSIADPVLVLDGRRTVQANRAAIRQFGTHLLREDVRVALRHPALLELLATASASRAPQSTVITGLGGSGLWWEARTAPVADDRMILHLVDRTAARAADRTRTDFVANASHELRTPLASIMGFVEQLQGEAGGLADVRANFLRVIDREARRMQQLTEDLLSLSRIESERHAPPRTPLSLDTLARAAVHDVRARGLPDGRTIDLDVGGALPQIAGDEGQLRQLIANLIDNALKYGRVGTPVRVALERSGALLELTVTDQGEGIASEHLPRLTERFYRVDTGRSRRIGGTGLGLSIAKHIVERHRGTLRIQSVQGSGTTVTVRLPEFLAA